MQEFTFVLTDQDVQIIEVALRELPFKHSAPVLQKLGAQTAAATSSQKSAQEDEQKPVINDVKNPAAKAK